MNAILKFTVPAGSSEPSLPAGHRARILRFPDRRPAPVAPAAPVPVKRKRGSTIADDQRRSMLAKVHMAKADCIRRLPGFDDTVYRDILEINFGVSSAADLDNQQLHKLLLFFAGQGWQARKGKNRRSAPKILTNDLTGMSREDKMGKIEAMLAEKGRVEGTDVPWGYAVSILKRQTASETDGPYKRFDDNRVTPAHLDAVIAALYKDAKRKGRRAR